jgi:peptidase E
MTAARKIVLLGGGFSDDSDSVLDDFVLSHAKGTRPKVCFLPTASGDADGYIERFYTVFAERQDCEPLHLPLFHYNSEAGRRQEYLSAVASKVLPGGWALDDGVAALFVDEDLADVVTRTPDAALHRVARDDSLSTGPTPETTETRLTARSL